jgi:hypothetical protein
MTIVSNNIFKYKTSLEQTNSKIKVVPFNIELVTRKSYDKPEELYEILTKEDKYCKLYFDFDFNTKEILYEKTQTTELNDSWNAILDFLSHFRVKCMVGYTTDESLVRTNDKIFIELCSYKDERYLSFHVFCDEIVSRNTLMKWVATIDKPMFDTTVYKTCTLTFRHPNFDRVIRIKGITRKIGVHYPHPEKCVIGIYEGLPISDYDQLYAKNKVKYEYMRDEKLTDDQKTKILNLMLKNKHRLIRWPIKDSCIDLYGILYSIEKESYYNKFVQNKEDVDISDYIYKKQITHKSIPKIWYTLESKYKDIFYNEQYLEEIINSVGVFTLKDTKHTHKQLEQYAIDKNLKLVSPYSKGRTKYYEFIPQDN